MILVDTGPLVALINSRDQYHQWARDLTRELSEPMLTCDAVLSEAYFLVGKSANGMSRLSDIMISGAVQSDFASSANLRELTALMRQYGELPMSFADACLVRMCELRENSQLLTTDSHFKIYRRNGDQPIDVIDPGI